MEKFANTIGRAIAYPFHSIARWFRKDDGGFITPDPKSIWITALAWTVQLAGFAFCSFLIYCFAGIWLAKLDVATKWVCLVTFGGGTIAWATVLLKTPMFSWFFIINGPLEAVVLKTQTTRDLIPKKVNDRVGQFAVGSLREVGPGFHAKLPSEVIAGKSIDLESSLLIGNTIDGDKPEPHIVYLEDGSEIELAWRAKLKPLRGFLVNLIQYRDDEQISYFLSEFRGFLSREFSKFKNEEAALKWLEDIENDEPNHKKIDKALKNLFSGPDVADDREIARGISTGGIEFAGYRRSKDLQKVKQTGLIIEEVRKSVTKLQAAYADPTTKAKLNPNLLTVIAAQTAGIELDANIFVGLEGSDQNAVAALATLSKKKKKGTK